MIERDKKSESYGFDSVAAQVLDEEDDLNKKEEENEAKPYMSLIIIIISFITQLL